jgi:hypothetical protein
MLNPSLLAYDASGRIRSTAVATFPSPNFNGGTPANNTGSIVIAAALAPQVWNDGLPYRNDGSICTASAGAITTSSNGLPLTATGALAISLDAAIASRGPLGLPLDATGRVVLVTPV